MVPAGHESVIPRANAGSVFGLSAIGDTDRRGPAAIYRWFLDREYYLETVRGEDGQYKHLSCSSRNYDT